MDNRAIRGGLIAVLATQVGCSQQSIDFGGDLAVQPRVNVGTQYYEFTQDAKAPTPGQFTDTTSRELKTSSSKLAMSDVMPLVNGGLTLFKGKFSLDFDVQYAFNGNGRSSYTNRSYVPQGYRNLAAFAQNPGDVTSSSDIVSEFDRTEYSFTLGYQVNEHLLLYAGYKRAFTDFYQDQLAGRVDAVNPVNGQTIAASTGEFAGITQLCLDYEGPFVGAKAAWSFSHGALDGLLTGHAGVAFLDASQTLSGTVAIKRDDGVQASLPIDAFGQRTNLSGFSGDSIGWVLGVGWRGVTAYPALSYSAAVNAYQYTFSDRAASDVSEMAVRFDVGLAYSFDF